MASSGAIFGLSVAGFMGMYHWLSKQFENKLTGVELHVHLDGCLTADLLLKLFSKHGEKMDLTKQELHSKITILGRTGSLAEVLAPFIYFLPLIEGKLEVLEDIAYYFVKRQLDSNVLYTEVRYSPQILRKDKSSDEVVAAICRGLKRGQDDFGVIVRSILCVMRHLPPKEGFEVVDLVKKYSSQGVVGIDLAGDEKAFANELFVDIFQKAKDEGLNITIHAGEADGHESVTSALEKLHAQRIGHGYHCIDHADCYKRVREQQICLEVCPTSSYRTSAVQTDMGVHPIHQFKKDNINWVIGTDDPGLFDITYDYEINQSRDTFNLDDKDLARSFIRGLEASFLPEDEKTEVMETLRKRLGMRSA